MLNLNGNPLDFFNIHPAIHPVDLGAGANNGLWVSLKGYFGCLVVVQKEAGAAGEDPIFTLQQATDVAGTGAKALNFSTVRQKLDTTTVPGVWTEIANPTGDNSYVDDTAGEEIGMIAVDVKADQLDLDNNFDCIQLSIPDVGVTAGQLGAGFYVLYGARYGHPAMISPIAN